MLRPFSAENQQKSPFEMEEPRILSFKNAPWPLVDWLDCLTTPQLFFFMEVFARNKSSSSWIQTQMVCGLPFGNQKSFIFQSTILMFLSDKQFFRQDKEERFKRLKEFITRIPGAVDLCLPLMTKIPGNANCEAEHFESSSCLNFSWLDKPKTWCGDCQLQPISKGLMICTQKNTPFFGCFNVSGLQNTKKYCEKKTWILPTHKIVQSKNNFVGASNQ